MECLRYFASREIRINDQRLHYPGDTAEVVSAYVAAGSHGWSRKGAEMTTKPQEAASAGIGFGVALAIAISWSTNKSILWVIVLRSHIDHRVGRDAERRYAGTVYDQRSRREDRCCSWLCVALPVRF